MGYYRFLGKKEGNYLYLTDDELKHAKVRRIKKGEKIEVNTLDGNVYLAEVEEFNKKYLKAKILKSIEQQEGEFFLELFLAIPNRPSKIDELIEPISELGVKRLIPVISEFSAVKEKDILKKLNKWNKIALNSIKQCKRLYPLEISNPIKIENIEPAGEGRFVFYEKEREKSLKDFMDRKYKSISIYIGNEGGISEKDLEILKNKDFITVSLSKNILRMETAVITAICQTSFVFGD